MVIAALVTGRGNNTLKDKNILNVLGKPLMAYPCIEAKKCVAINFFYISSDDDKILSVGEQYGYKRIKRPSYLALPTSQHKDTILHAINEIQNDIGAIDILVVLLANNATVKAEWIKKSIDMILEDDEISAVVPVEVDQDHHPYRAKTVDENGSLIPFFDFSGKSISTNRQDLSKCVFLCHNFWTLNCKNSILSNSPGQQPWTFLGNNIKPIEVSNCFDVHTLEDIKKTENWLKLYYRK